MKTLLMLCAALAAVAMAGCADMRAEVRASHMSTPLGDDRTYEFTRTPPQEANPDHRQYEALLRQQLSHNGFTSASADRARYVVSLAYDTRPADINVGVTGCETSTERCDTPLPGANSPGRPLYRHSMTLRLFERSTGQEVYKVSATQKDRDADPLHAAPYLVTSVMAKFPFDGHADWLVKMHPDGADHSPRLTTVEPVGQ